MLYSKRYITVIFMLLSLISFGEAQSPVDRNVTVERDFQPVIQDAGKITGLPEIQHVKTTKERVDYSEIYQPLPFEKNMLTLSAEEVLHQRRKASREAFIRLGGGNYWNTVGDVVLPIIKNEKNRLDLILKHVGTFGDKQHALSRGTLDYNHYFSTYDLYAGVAFSHQYFNYYGNNFYGSNGDTITTNNLKGYSDLLSAPQPIYKEQKIDRITRFPQEISLADLANSPLYDMLWRYHAHVGIRSLPNATEIGRASCRGRV